MKGKKLTRCEVLLKFWNEGEEESALEGRYSTDSLRAARMEFRRRLKSLLPYDKLRPAEKKGIMEAGYVVAKGWFVRDTNRFAMQLIDRDNPNPRPPMYAFTIVPNGFCIQRFDPE